MSFLILQFLGNKSAATSDSFLCKISNVMSPDPSSLMCDRQTSPYNHFQEKHVDDFSYNYQNPLTLELTLPVVKSKIIVLGNSGKLLIYKTPQNG